MKPIRSISYPLLTLPIPSNSSNKNPTECFVHNNNLIYNRSCEGGHAVDAESGLGTQDMQSTQNQALAIAERTVQFAAARERGGKCFPLNRLFQQKK